MGNFFNQVLTAVWAGSGDVCDVIRSQATMQALSGTALFSPEMYRIPNSALHETLVSVGITPPTDFLIAEAAARSPWLAHQYSLLPQLESKYWDSIIIDRAKETLCGAVTVLLKHPEMLMKLHNQYPEAAQYITLSDWCHASHPFKKTLITTFGWEIWVDYVSSWLQTVDSITLADCNTDVLYSCLTHLDSAQLKLLASKVNTHQHNVIITFMTVMYTVDELLELRDKAKILTKDTLEQRFQTLGLWRNSDIYPLFLRYTKPQPNLVTLIGNLTRHNTAELTQEAWDFLQKNFHSHNQSDVYEACILSPANPNLSYYGRGAELTHIPDVFYSEGLSSALVNCLAILRRCARRGEIKSEVFLRYLVRASDNVFSLFDAKELLVKHPSYIRTLIQWKSVETQLRLTPQRFYLNPHLSAELVLYWIQELKFQPEIKFFIYWAEQGRWDIIQDTQKFARANIQPNIQRLLAIASLSSTK